MVSSSALYALSLLVASSTLVDATALMERTWRESTVPAHRRMIRASRSDGFVSSKRASTNLKRSDLPKRCKARYTSSSSSSSAPSTTTSTKAVAPNAVGGDPTTTSSAPAATTTTKSSSGGGGGGGGAGAPVKAANWPTVTQAGNNYKSTVATEADPYLLSISEALNNDNTPDYNKVQSGDMTYYEQGQTACGDYYTDDTWTAAVSHELWDAWPGSANVDTDRSPICGPYVPGRQILNAAGGYTTVKPAPASSLSSKDMIIIGGDGLPNCQSGVGLTGQCHIPLTITITNPANGKKAVVKMVDKCGGCAGYGDIDVTPTVFAYLSDMDLGRTPVTWEINHF